MPPTTNWSGLHTNGSDASFKVDIIIFIVQIIISTNKELCFYEVLTKYYKRFTQWVKYIKLTVEFHNHAENSGQTMVEGALTI